MKQTYENIEIIVVNDGSTDDSLQIANKLKDIDDRILVFSKDNGGLASARNFGLAKSRGEYIIYIDSDDYIAALQNEITMVASLKNQSYSEVERILDQNFSKLIKK